MFVCIEGVSLWGVMSPGWKSGRPLLLYTESYCNHHVIELSQGGISQVCDSFTAPISPYTLQMLQCMAGTHLNNAKHTGGIRDI